MKLRNPWIDPRVAQVRPPDASAYLLARSWKQLPDADGCLSFAGPGAGDDAPVVLVPLREQGRDYVQRVIELVTDVALAEERYAVDVLNDILAGQESTTNGAPVHGANAQSARASS